jgi:hypothetical protein
MLFFDYLKRVLNPSVFLCPALVVIWFVIRDLVTWSLLEKDKFCFNIIMLCIFCSIAIWLYYYLAEFYSINLLVYFLIFFLPLIYVIVKFDIWLISNPILAIFIIPTLFIEELLHQRLVWEIL